MRKVAIVLFLIVLMAMSILVVGCRKARAGPEATAPGPASPLAATEEPAGVDTTTEPAFEDVDVDLGDVI